MDNMKPLKMEEIPFKTRYKLYKKELKVIKEKYNPKSSRKFARNKNWREDWKGYVEYTYPWDGSCIFDLILYRLEVLAANLKYLGHHINDDKDAEEILEAVKLGRKVVEADGYYEPARQFANEHCAHVINIHINLGDKKHYKYGEKIGEIVRKVVSLEEYFGDDDVEAWCKEHGYDKKTIITSYEGRWDSKANQEIYRKMNDDTVEQIKADRKKFFNILADRLESWWD